LIWVAKEGGHGGHGGSVPLSPPVEVHGALAVGPQFVEVFHLLHQKLPTHRLLAFSPVKLVLRFVSGAVGGELMRVAAGECIRQGLLGAGPGPQPNPPPLLFIHARPVGWVTSRHVTLSH
jgi:hypothetical protein